MKKRTVHYIVSARCYEVKAVTGSVMTKDDELVWLGESYGYAACCRSRSNAKKFKSIPSLGAIKAWDGMPWYFRLKPDTVKVYRVTTTTVEPVVEEEEVND